MDELKNAAIHDLGIIWTMDTLVKNEVENGQLVEIQIDGTQATAELYCYFLQTSKEDKKRILAEYLLENVTIS